MENLSILSTRNFKLIACVNEKLALGKDNQLLYRIKSDLQNFKRMTTNNVVIMGRKTFESLPNGPLPNRVNIVLTTYSNYPAEGCIIAHSFQEVFQICSTKYFDKEWYVIGGASTYDMFLREDAIYEILLTTVKDNKDGDTYLPSISIDSNIFPLYYQSDIQTDGTFSYTFSVRKRK